MGDSVKRWCKQYAIDRMIQHDKGNYVHYDDFARVVAERDALAAVVAKLPHTFDGIPVVPGMTIWYDADGPMVIDRVSFGDDIAVYCESDYLGNPSGESSERAWSTNEVAAAALTAKALPTAKGNAAIDAEDKP